MDSINQVESAFRKGMAIGYRLGCLAEDKYEDMDGDNMANGEPWDRAVKEATEELSKEFVDKLRVEAEAADGVEGLTPDLLEDCQNKMVVCLKDTPNWSDDDILTTMLDVLNK